MRLQDNTDFTTLHWVKAELDEALAKARQALETYVEDPADTIIMRSCAADLHQVHGTLRMVELYGAAMVVEEMEHLVAALMAGTVAQRDDAYAALMRGMVQMPDYLERLQSGHRDVPIVLLPLLNDLRASRGEQQLHESALFTPNLDTALPAAAPGASEPGAAEHYRAEISTLRVRFQQQLLAWFRGQSTDRQLLGMRATLDGLAARCYTVPGRRLWWIAAGVLEGLERGVLKAHASEVRQLIGRVDRCIRELVEGGEEALQAGDADELSRKLLYYVAQAKPGSERLDELRQTYRLAGLLPNVAELEHARGSMSGHNRALLDTVAHAIKDDLLRVKDALDLFLRRPNADPEQLGPQAEVLERVGDTLGMLALAVPRRVVNEQRRIVDEIATRMRAPDEESLLDVAGALLYVEASLDDHIERLGAGDDALENVDPLHAPLPRSEARSIISTLMREATANTAKVKDAIVAFVESSWDHARLHEVPQQMAEIGGAMIMLGATRPAVLAEGIARFVQDELIEDRRVPTGTQMDRLADALAALEYYLEAAREHRGGLEHILDVTEQSLAKLGYWPVPAPREAVKAVSADAGEPLEYVFEGVDEREESSAVGPVHAHGVSSVEASEAHADGGRGDLGQGDFGQAYDELADAEPEVAAQAEGHAVEEPTGEYRTEAEPAEVAPVVQAQSKAPEVAQTYQSDNADHADWVEIEEEVEQEVGGDDMAEFAGFQITVDGIDDEIREIFLEEMQEEIDNLNAGQAEWLKNPEKIDALTPVRRSFHTLKGSGRLVGARLLGEFSWKVENMLNRVLDTSIEPHEGVQALVRHAIAALPSLLIALKGEGTPTAPLAAIMETADRLAAGEQANIEEVVAGTRQLVRTKIKRRVPRNEIADVPTGAFASFGSHQADELDFVDEDALPGPALPPVDPVLLDILRSEVAQYQLILRQAVVSAQGGELHVDDALLRAVHTLHGAIGMVDIPVLIQVLAPLEGLLKRLRASASPLTGDDMGLLTQTADLVDHIMAQFDVAVPDVPNVDALAARITAMRDAQPEAMIAHVLYEPDPVLEHIEHAPEPVIGADETSLAETSPVEDEQPEAGQAEADEHPLVAAEQDLAAELLAAFDSFDIDAQKEVVQADVLSTEALDDDAWKELLGELEDEVLEPVPPTPVVEGFETPTHDIGGDTHVPAPLDDAAWQELLGDLGEEPVVEDEFVGTVSTEQPEAVESPAHVEPVDIAEPLEDLDRVESVEPVEHVEHVDHVEPVIAETTSEDNSDVLADEIAQALELESAINAPAHEEHVASNDDDILPVPELDEVEPLVAEAVVDTAGKAGTAYPGVDPDLLEIFVEEGRDILDHADGVLALWREEPQLPEHVAGLQRDLHTLKGSARMVGLVAVGDLSHAMEALLDAVANGQRESDAPAIEALEGGFDKLHSMVQRIALGQPIELTEEMIEPFARLAGGTIAPVTAADVSEQDPHIAEMTAAAPAPFREMPDLLPEFDEEQSRAPQEQIRVRADLLDTLVNHAGEVSIYRSRLEQQIAGFRFNLIEHEATVSRLRGQLRMLEIETEAQIIARYQHEHRELGVTAFDPLELDRFSGLQQYSRALAESVSDLVSIQTMLDDLTRQSETLLLQQSRVNSELQEGLMRTRMVPFDAMVPNLRRTLRQAAQDMGKRVQLHVDGAHGEMDRNLLDRIKAPFEHMLRNAVAHGIESPRERERAGKPAEGAVRIQVSREATEVVIRVSDDGAGMDRDAIRAKAIERGLLRADARINDDQLLALTQTPGFSTARKVTQLAGRGVGMDVVANEIKQLGGTLSIESTKGTGTSFILRLPFTLAVTQAILVRIGEAVFAIPMTSVQGVARITPDELQERLNADDPSFVYGGESYGIYDLGQLLNQHTVHAVDDLQLPLLLTRSGDLRAAIRIDAVIGSREIVVKPVGPQISSVPGILGATIMGDGSVLMILDLAPLVRHGLARRAHELENDMPALVPVIEEVRTRPLVMVVDDSITMRKVTGRVLERHEFEVATAKDGIDAIEKLYERVPDLMLLDIEMPRMDGYELATYMKNDSRLRNVPIIMITSRTGDKHRQRAFDIGVERYIGKPYQESDLIVQINAVLGIGSPHG